MPSESQTTLGMLLMLLAGFIDSLMVIAGSFAKEMEWPYFRLMATAAGVICAASFAVAAVWRSPLPDMQQFIWLMLRGGFGAVTFFLMIAAVRFGASLGDAASMASINTVIAALLGRLLLSEKLQCVHGLAVVCSLGGSVLICRPGFFFGTSNPAYVGYLVAAASGFMQACVFISARMLQGTSVPMPNMSVAGWCVLAFAVLPYTPLLDDFSMQPVWDHPVLGFGFVAGYVGLLGSGIITYNVAGMRCPAAVSATMTTGSKMLSGYVAQTLFFGQSPDLITLAGAALMLAAVVLMAAPRSLGDEAPAEKEAQTPAAGQSTAKQEHGDEDELASLSSYKSLASFIAAEFGSPGGGLRQRHVKAKKMQADDEPHPEVVGTSAVLSALESAVVLSA